MGTGKESAYVRIMSDAEAHRMAKFPVIYCIC